MTDPGNDADAVKPTVAHPESAEPRTAAEVAQRIEQLAALLDASGSFASVDITKQIAAQAEVLRSIRRAEVR